MTHLWCTNSNADIYIFSIYDIFTINDCIYNGLILKSTNRTLKKQGNESQTINYGVNCKYHTYTIPSQILT